MSKLTEKIELYKKSLKEVEPDFDAALVEKVTKGLGPSIYNRDSELVSCSDEKELDTVRKNFLKKKLGIEDEEKINSAIKEVCEKLKGTKRKYRAVFYYLLVKLFGKEDVYS